MNSVFDIKIDQSAIEAVKLLAHDDLDLQKKSLRIYLSGKNCDGFEYGVCFDSKANDDLEQISQDISFICDHATYEFVQGSTLKYVTDERGRGFLVENPNHSKFRGKFFKKKAWVQKFEKPI